jgi:hypothetical protein
MRTLLILLLFPFAAISGGSHWYLNPGGFTLNASYQFIRADKYFDNDGEVQDLQNFEYNTSTIFLDAQYGISNRINAGFHFPAIVHSQGEFLFNDSTGTKKVNQSSSAVGDAELFCKVKIYNTVKSTFVFTARFVLPSGINDNRYDLNSGYGTLGEAGIAEYIYKHNEKLYAQAYGGYLHRGNDFTDEVSAGGDVGYRLLTPLWTVFTCRAINPLENGNDLKTGGAPGLGRNNSGYIRLGLEVDYAVGSKVDLFIRSEYPVRGQFVQASPVFEAGIGIFFDGRASDD